MASDEGVRSYPALVVGDTMPEDEENKPEFTARGCVFDTTELLENVLVHLPANDILLSKQVCKAFRNCYLASRQLQLKTFVQVKKIEPKGTVPDLSNPSLAFPFTINLSLLRWPIVAIALGRPRPSKLVMKMKHLPVGVQDARLIAERNKDLTFKMEFVSHLYNDSWSVTHVGSWTEQYLTDAAFPALIRLKFIDKRTSEDGRLITTKTVRTVFHSQKARRIGYIIQCCQVLNRCLIRYIFELPPRTDHLFQHILTGQGKNDMGLMKEIPRVTCTVDTLEERKMLN